MVATRGVCSGRDFAAPFRNNRLCGQKKSTNPWVGVLKTGVEIVRGSGRKWVDYTQETRHDSDPLIQFTANT